MNRILATIGALLIVYISAGCSPGPLTDRTVVTPTELYSDDEFATIERRVVTTSDLATIPPADVKLASGVHVRASATGKTLVISSVPVAFTKVQVADGPAQGRWGWLPNQTIK